MEFSGKHQRNWLINTVITVLISLILTLPFFLDVIIVLPLIVSLIVFLAYLSLNDITVPYLHLLYLLIALAILSPPIKLSSSLPLIRVEEFILYGIFPLILILNFNNFKLSKEAKTFVQIYSTFLILVLISTLFGYIFLNVPTSIRDLFEFATYSKYLLVFLTIYSFNISSDKIPRILYFILGMVILSGAFGLLQYFGVLNLDNITGPYYLQERIYIIHDRLTATYKNPNTYSAILTTSHLIALGLFFYEDKKSRKSLLLACIAVIAVFMLFAGSRTMIAAYLLVTIIMILIGASKAGYKKSQIVTLILVLGVSFLVAVSFISYRILVRLESGLDIFSDESFALRMLAWYLNIQLFIESPVIGWGAAKAIHTTIVDNEYILILRRFGVLGLFSFLAYYLHPLYVSFKNLKSESKNILLFSSVLFTVIITFLIAGLTNSLYHNMQVMDLWIVILSLYYISIRNNKDLQTTQ